MARLENQICPNCGSKDLDQDLRCGHCGSQLRWGDTEKTVLRIAGLSSACPKCSFENPAQDRFCAKCGTSLVFICAICEKDHPLGTLFCVQTGENIAEHRIAITRGSVQSSKPSAVTDSGQKDGDGFKSRPFQPSQGDSRVIVGPPLSGILKTLADKAARPDFRLFDVHSFENRAFVGTDDAVFILNAGLGETGCDKVLYSELQGLILAPGLFGTSTLVFKGQDSYDIVIRSRLLDFNFDKVVDTINACRASSLPRLALVKGTFADMPQKQGNEGCIGCISISVFTYFIWWIFHS